MLLALLALADAAVVDRILHVVDQRVITASDVALEAEIDPYDESAVTALEDPGYPYEWRLVDYAILREAAGDVEVFKPSPDAVALRWQRLRARFPTPEAYAAFLARWGLTEDDLLGWLYSRLVVERYVERSLAGARDRSYADWMAELRARAVIRSPGVESP